MTSRILSASRWMLSNRPLTICSWLAVICTAALVVGALPATAANNGSCRPEPGATKRVIALDSGQPGLFKFPGDDDKKNFTLEFHESRGLDHRTLNFEGQGLSGGKTPIRAEASLEQDLRGANGQTIEENAGLSIVAWVDEEAKGGKPSRLRVCVEVDPSRIHHLHAGRYQGFVVLTADNFADERIPIDVTFRSPKRQALTFAFGGFVIGLVVKILTELGSGQRSSNPGGWHALQSYLRQWSFPVAVILGLLAFWIAYTQIYNANETWGADGSDTLKLFGACFGFQLGSIGGV